MLQTALLAANTDPNNRGDLVKSITVLDLSEYLIVR